MSDKRYIGIPMYPWIQRWIDACNLAEAQRDELSDAIKAALADDPDWRRLCVDALARAEGRMP